MAATTTQVEEVVAEGGQSLLKAHMELGKVRLSAMVVFTTALGYVVASKMNYLESMDWGRLLWTCLGTFLAAVGASAFNQTIETRQDRLMTRTRNRPLVRRRLSRTYGATFGLIVSIVGVAILCPKANGLTAILAAANVVIYAFIYTPLKRLSTVNTLVGAVVGGIPPMIGWAAATERLPLGAWVLGGILFVWQIPHFLALAWMYREDYAKGGFLMLPGRDPTGRQTSMMALTYALLLAPLCLMMVFLGHAGWIFAVAAVGLTVGLVWVALKFVKVRGNAEARRLFLASIVYLPLLSAVLMVDARGPMDGFLAMPGALVLPTTEKFVEPGMDGAGNVRTGEPVKP